MQNHHNLVVWQKAQRLAVEVYQVTRRLSQVERSGLASQARRAAQSVRGNIVEGCSRSSNREFARFLQTSIASASELEDHLQFAQDVKLLSCNDATRLLEQTVEIRRMLYGLLKRVQDEGGRERN